MICYAVKANSNQAVLTLLAREGAGADVVSGGELQRALLAGIMPQRIVFTGVGKKECEIVQGLDAGILQFNCESEAELEMISRVAKSRGVRAPVALRVNPSVDAMTHEKISTGRAEDKFGIPWDRALDTYALAAKLPGIEVVGIDVHIGSQLVELNPFQQSFSKIAELIATLRQAGHKIIRADLGGGLGIPYQAGSDAPPLPSDYAEIVHRIMGKLDVQVIFEPGRLIVGNAGLLMTSVILSKYGQYHRFIVVDAAMNDLLRPAMYDAWHDILPMQKADAYAAQTPATIVGPVCESSDVFAKDRLLPPVEAGDKLAIFSAGAYGAVMASGYNTRPLVPEVLVRGSRFDVIRPRQTLDDLIAMDNVPKWLVG